MSDTYFYPEPAKPEASLSQSESDHEQPDHDSRGHGSRAKGRGMTRSIASETVTVRRPREVPASMSSVTRPSYSQGYSKPNKFSL